MWGHTFRGSSQGPVPHGGWRAMGEWVVCNVPSGQGDPASVVQLTARTRVSSISWCLVLVPGRQGEGGRDRGGQVGWLHLHSPHGRAASPGGSGLSAVRGAGLWPRTSALNGDHVKCVPAQRVLVGLYLPGGGSSQGPDLPAALWVTSTCLKQVMLPSQADDADDKESTL